MIVLDTSVVLAFMNRGDASHQLTRDWMGRQSEELVITPLVLAELDHLVGKLGGRSAARALREDLRRGAYQIEWWPAAMRETLEIADLYGSMDLGLTDASLLALAAHLHTTSLATLDERHFRALRPIAGADAFTLLPADAPSRSPERR